MNPSLGKDGRPVLDEATFQKLLEAAYVVQEHSHGDNPSSPAEAKSEAAATGSDSTTTLAEIVETQHQIHADHLDLSSSSNLVADRIRKITGAQGAAIGILDQEKLVYRAGSGILASQVGTELRAEATLSASTLLHDTILRCPDARTDFRVNPEIAKRLGISSLISVPVFHDGKTAGALELVFANPNAFQEHDVRTCQLMAGLVTEALTHAAEEEWRKGVTAERASMLEVLERIKPQLARLAQEPKSPDPGDTATEAESSPEDSKCQHCGNELAPGEVFCGSCGTSRATISHGDLQNKWATLWRLKKASGQGLANSAAESIPTQPVVEKADSPASPSPAAEYYVLPDFILPEKTSSTAPLPIRAEPPALIEKHDEAGPAPPKLQEEAAIHRAEAPVEQVAVRKKPVESRVWLRSIAVSPPAVQFKGFWQKNKGFLRRHPGDLALAAALILFLVTIIWAISAGNPTTSADSGNGQAAIAGAPVKPKRKPAPPPPKLTMFEQLLVGMGLAEAPPAAPSYSGNPNIPVWVDVHTALYYCPGSDLYGKTPQGRIASQRDAQMDQFEPASRKVCD